jgi:putative phosphoribosyl transferase
MTPQRSTSTELEQVWASSRDEEVAIGLGSLTLHGRLTVPDHCVGMVIFAHGSGSSRHSPRNIEVADELRTVGLGTLLFDLLTESEEEDRSNVFDVELLAGRLAEVTHWLRGRPGLAMLPVGYFGASTGAAAALWAAATPRLRIAAVVSRGGRVDLARDRLAEVSAPTLLIVGGYDEVVLDLNRRAAAELTCEHELRVIPGASHLFAEGDALRTVSIMARDWFLAHRHPNGVDQGGAGWAMP